MKSWEKSLNAEGEDPRVSFKFLNAKLRNNWGTLPNLGKAE